MNIFLITLAIGFFPHNSQAAMESILCSKYPPIYHNTNSGDAFSTTDRTIVLDFDNNSGSAYWFGSLFGTVVNKSLKPLNGTSPLKEKITSITKGPGNTYQIALASLSTGEELGIVTIKINKVSGEGYGTWKFSRLNQGEAFSFCTNKVSK
jgi:hypothetical protein